MRSLHADVIEREEGVELPQIYRQLPIAVIHAIKLLPGFWNITIRPRIVYDTAIVISFYNYAELIAVLLEKFSPFFTLNDRAIETCQYTSNSTTDYEML